MDNNEEGTNLTTVYGIAAMSLLEAVVLTLREKGIMTEDEVDEALEAAILAHQNRNESHSDEENGGAAAILSQLRAHGNSVRLIK